MTQPLGGAPKVLVWDIETMAGVARFWGRKWDPRITEIVEYPYLLSVSWTWYDMASDTWGPVQFARKAEGYRDDRELALTIWGLLDQADYAIAHNGDRFDMTEVRARLLYHGFGEYSPVNTFDTRKLAARNFRLPSNSLNDIADYLELGRKVQHTGWDLWRRCEANDRDAWALMEEYNVHDTELLCQVFARMKTLVPLPKWNMQHWSGLFTCSHCGSSNVEKRGWGLRKSTKVRNVKCNAVGCGKWSYFQRSETDEDNGKYRPY